MEHSLERIDPDFLTVNEATGQETLRLHLDRYRYAGKFLKAGNCLDIACGIGYGTYLLATEFSSVVQKITGVDLELSAIEKARKRYNHPTVEYVQEDALKYCSHYSLQNIISLETLEHLPRPDLFVQHIGAQLNKGGRFIASAPITPSMDANPYHLQDFTEKRFTALFEKAGFRKIDSFVQVQPYRLFAVLNKSEERSKDLRKNLAGYYLTHPSKFFLRLYSLLKDGFNNKYLVAVFEKL